MTADSLIKLLKTLPPKTPILLARDSEGNSFHVLEEMTQEEFFDGVYIVAWPSHQVVDR